MFLNRGWGFWVVESLAVLFFAIVQAIVIVGVLDIENSWLICVLAGGGAFLWLTVSAVIYVMIGGRFD